MWERPNAGFKGPAKSQSQISEPTSNPYQFRTPQKQSKKKRSLSDLSSESGSESSDNSTSNASLLTEFDIQNIWKDIQHTITAIIDSDYRNYPQLQERDFSYAP